MVCKMGKTIIKFSYFFGLAALLWSILSIQCFAGGWDLIIPEKGDHLKLRINGNSSSYWRLDHDAETVIKVEGPTVLQLFTRAGLPDKKKETLYGIIAVRDNEERYFIGRGSVRTSGVKNPKNPDERITESRSIELKVPAGRHEFSFKKPREVKAPVYVRYLIEKEEETISYVAFLPRDFYKEVKLSIKEREYIYYRSTKDEPVELEVFGPTRIRGIARLEFDHSIRGDHMYRVQIKESDKIMNTVPLTGVVSGIASYVEPTEKLPARGENFYIDIPEGKHNIKVFTPDSDISVLFRFYIPQKDLGNAWSGEGSVKL